MDYKTKKNNNATVDLKITFTPEEIEESFKKAYKKAATKVKIPGFRPGKAPAHLVEKMLGDSVSEDAINLLIQDSFIELYPKLEFTPVYPPKFSVLSFDRGKSLVVKGVYETRPEVTLGKYKKNKIEVRKLKVTDEDIQENLEKIREKMARTQLKEGLAESGDLIEIDYTVKSADDSLQPAKQKVTYKLGDPNNPIGFDEKLSSASKGEVREFEYTFPEDYAVKSYAGKKFDYKVNVNDVYQIIYPEINDDLAMEWSGLATLAELKESLKKEISEYHEALLKQKYVQEIFTKIYDDSKFIIPESLLKEETENVFKQFKQETHLDMNLEKYAELLKKSVEEVTKQFEEIALKRIKAAVTKYKIAEEEKIQVEPEEFEKLLEKYANETNQSLNTVKTEIKKNKYESYFREKFLFEKINDFIYDITDKKGSKEILVKEAVSLGNGENK